METCFIVQYFWAIYDKIFKADTMSAFCVVKQIFITSISQPFKWQARFQAKCQKEHSASWIQFWLSELNLKQTVPVHHDFSHSLTLKDD